MTVTRLTISSPLKTLNQTWWKLSAKRQRLKPSHRVRRRPSLRFTPGLLHVWTDAVALQIHSHHGFVESERIDQGLAADQVWCLDWGPLKPLAKTSHLKASQIQNPEETSGDSAINCRW